MVAPKKQFYCNGEVTMWRYQATHAAEFQAIVFRPVGSSTTQFKVIGVNDIQVPVGEINTPVSYIVPEGKRIRVEHGDVIGWSFRDAAITFDMLSGTGHAGDAESNLVRWAVVYPAPLQDTIPFNNFGSREYSIEATIQVSYDIQTRS